MQKSVQKDGPVFGPPNRCPVTLKGGSPSALTTTLSLGQNRVPGIPPVVPPGMLPTTKDTGNERFRNRQNFPENLSS